MGSEEVMKEVSDDILRQVMPLVIPNKQYCSLYHIKGVKRVYKPTMILGNELTQHQVTLIFFDGQLTSDSNLKSLIRHRYSNKKRTLDDLVVGEIINEVYNDEDGAPIKELLSHISNKEKLNYVSDKDYGKKEKL